jgi:glycosyltransferase involved in cell wall biosynthesis
MKVGLVLDNLPPQLGGAYSFVCEVLSALERQRHHSKHELVICHPEAGEGLAKQFPSFPALNLGRAKFANFTNRERYFAPFGLGEPRRSLDPTDPSWEDRIFVRENFHFLVRLCPVGEPLTVSIPYATTLWDLQHRISPWFPEVSFAKEWDRRETSFTTLLRRATVIYTGTEQGRQEVTHFYQVPKERIKVMPYGTPKFALDAAELPRNAAALPPDLGDYLFYPARFWPHKNQVVMLEACKLVRERTGWDLGVVFTGIDGGNLVYVREYAQWLGLEQRTRFLHFVERDQLIELYKGAFCLVFPSYFGPDNLPPLEAFAMRCPVIASDIPGAREQFGDAAILFPPSDEHALGEAILSLRDAKQRARLIAAGLARAGAHSWDDYARGILQSLDEFARVRRNWP